MTSRRLIGPVVAACLLVLAACTSSETGPADPGRTSTSPDAPADPSPSESATAAEGAARPSGSLVRSVFFGMHEGRVTQGVTPSAPVGALRFWDAGTTWRDLEPTPGQFSWQGLDTAVSAAEKAHARPLLVLGQSPTFYASKPEQDAAYGPGAASMPDLQAWKRYVTAVVQRYGTRLDYQVWNEADVVGYWSGTARQMAELTVSAGRIIHHVEPRAVLAAPPFVLRLPSQQRDFKSFWSLQSKGVDLAGAVDAVALNLYPPAEDPPESELPLFSYAVRVLQRSGVDLPIWNTEINYGLLGGPTPPAISPVLQRAFVMRTYLLNAGLGVPRVYWYRWDLAPIANTLLTTPDFSTPTPAGASIATLRDWLLGARVEPCRATAGVWRCEARADGSRVEFWWKPHGPSERLAAPSGTRSWTDASGRTTPCRGRCRIPVDQSPVRLVLR